MSAEERNRAINSLKTMTASAPSEVTATSSLIETASETGSTDEEPQAKRQATQPARDFFADIFTLQSASIIADEVS